MQQEIEIVRLVGDERRVGPTLESVSRHWQKDKEHFMFISPHDDDVVLGGGLLIQLAIREKVLVHILIVTDGSMGYCSREDRDSISDIRKKETYKCYESLGIPRENIIWLGFPDCQLNSYRGRYLAQRSQKPAIEGFTGLQNAFTYYLRKICPTQCFLPTSNDLHPDHEIVHSEFLISMFHSAGSIWPELGEPVEKVPYVHEMGIYCDFPVPPRLRIKTPESCLENKLGAISAFKSQKQIASVVDIVSKSGPYEYISSLDFRLYRPGKYYDLFEQKHHIPFTR